MVIELIAHVVQVYGRIEALRRQQRVGRCLQTMAPVPRKRRCSTGHRAQRPPRLTAPPLGAIAHGTTNLLSCFLHAGHPVAMALPLGPTQQVCISNGHSDMTSLCMPLCSFVPGHAPYHEAPSLHTRVLLCSITHRAVVFIAHCMQSMGMLLDRRRSSRKESSRVRMSTTRTRLGKGTPHHRPL